ncbi:MAG: single-stranded-DNA-specific exonuclease RecJ [Candidatus Beckwithbacteria bacterium]
MIIAVMVSAVSLESIIQILLKKRGLITKKVQTEFLSPTKPEKLSLVSVGLDKAQITQALNRLTLAKKNRQLIFIYGDYDADGISSTAILWETLTACGFNALPYLPVRDDPVRGLSPFGLNQILAKHQPQLIITVDNGISAFKGCQLAKKLRLDVIITDHHLPKTKNHQITLPQAQAIIHTTQLAGAGVSWFFSLKIAKHFSGPCPPLDLAALGTIADMVPLLSANRSLARFGLNKLRFTKRPGLISLAKVSKIDLNNLEDYQVSYTLAPRLNALGRLEHALDALRLLCTHDPTRAAKLAEHLIAINQLRQDKTLSMFQDAKLKLKNLAQNSLIFVADKSYHEGVVGLVAGRLMEEFNLPAVVVAVGKNTSKASARSVKGFNVLRAIRQLEPYLLEHGGHELAAGFTFANKHLKTISAKLKILANQALSGKNLSSTTAADCNLDFNQLNWKLYTAIQEFKPYGFANPQPVFQTKKVKVVSFRPVGQANKHLKLTLEQSRVKLEAIAFNFGYLAAKLQPSQPINITYTLESNTWNSHKSLQLKIKDIV